MDVYSFPMNKLLRTTLLLAWGAASFCTAFGQAPSAQAAGAIRPKVVIVVYFEIGADTGDNPGELQQWVERDHLTRIIDVPGMTRHVRANADGSEIAVAVGPGAIKPGINLMALGSDPRFDLRESHWLINGIAGISPEDGTVGAAVWTDFVINGDLAKLIDPREIPADWPDGFMSLDGVTQRDPKGITGMEEDVRTWSGNEARANKRGNVIRMNLALMQWAYGMTKQIKLPEDAAMKQLRTRYKSAATRTGPQVQTGANLTTELFWHGAKMDAWAHRWVTFETDGVSKLGTTAENDSGAMLALQALTKQGRADWNKALLLRTASNFDMPPPGVTAAENLASEKHGSYTAYLPALESAYMVGERAVAEWMK
jgi:purine nucleoside permease